MDVAMDVVAMDVAMDVAKDDINICLACGGRVLLDAKAAELSCSECGLVKCNVFDDRAMYGQYEDRDQYDHDDHHEYNEHQTVHNIKLYYTVRDYMYNLFPNRDIDEEIRSVCSFCSKHNTKTKDAIAVAVYALKNHGICAKTLCDFFKIDISVFWHKYRTIMPAMNQNDTLLLVAKRALYECDNIDGSDISKALRTIYKFIDKIKDSPCLQKVKLDKFGNNLVIIALCANKVKVNKKSMCLQLQTSLSSLRKHEAILQNILAK